MSPGNETPPAVGQIRRQTLLDSEAVYRVVALTRERAVLEVISSPGLASGYRFEVTRDAAARMTLDGASEAGR